MAIRSTVLRRPIGLAAFACVVLGTTAALLPVQPASAATGDQLRQVTVTNSGNGRGMAFDGQHLYYTLEGDASIYETDTQGNAIQTIQSPAAGGPLAWDGTSLWTMDYSANSDILYQVGLDGTVLSQCSLSAANPGDPGIAGIENYPDGLDYSNGSLWISNEINSSPPWVVQVDTSCKVQSEFQPPTDSAGEGPSGIAVVGNSLWAAYPQTGLVQQMSLGGTLTGVSFSTGSLELEDLAFDSTTFAPTCALWGNEAALGNNELTAYEVPCTSGPAPPPLKNGDYKIATATQEPSLAVDPNNPQHIVVGFNSVGGLFNQYVHCGFAASWDGGKTWTSAGTLGSVGQQGSRGDPSVAFAPNGNVFYACMTERTHILNPADKGIGVYVSHDGGQTFKGVTLADSGSVAGKIGYFDDQETLTIGPNGRPHICFAAINSSSVENVEVLDGLNTTGSKWSAPRVVTGTPDHKSFGCGIAVTGTGRLWVSWWDKTAHQARVAYRNPGSTQFTRVGSIGRKVNDSSGSLDFQVHLAADPRAGANGVVATWDTGTSNGADVLIADTTGTTWYGDCGATDSTPCVASPMTNDAEEPAISWGSDGKILIGFYQVANGLWTYTIGRADDLNQPFGYRTAASAASDTSAQFDSPFTRLGDYSSVAEASDGSVYAAWSDTRNGSQEVWGAS